MKNTVKKIAAVAMIVFVSESTRANNGRLYVEVKDKTLVLSEHNVSGEVQQSIYTEDGSTVLQSKVFSGRVVNKYFLLGEMKAGKYVVEYNDEFKVQTVSITLGETLLLDLENAKVDYLPFVSKRGSVINIGMLSDAEQEIEVKIYKDDRLIVSELVSGSDYFGKGFYFSKIRRAIYNVVVSSGGRTYHKTVSI